MPMPRGRRRLTCHHEAGHALVRWYFGHRTDRAVVLTVEELRAGVTVENHRGIEVACEGIVDGWEIHEPPFGPRDFGGASEAAAAAERWREIGRDVELMTCAAGMAAEAAYRRVSVLACAIGGGDGDLKFARTILDAWFPSGEGRREAMFLAERRAAALVRSAPGSAAIGAMADALMERGEIDGDEIDTMCRRAYGGRQCEFGGWNALWPPTLAQIRSGFIPEPAARAA